MPQISLLVHSVQKTLCLWPLRVAKHAGRTAAFPHDPIVEETDLVSDLLGE